MALKARFKVNYIGRSATLSYDKDAEGKTVARESALHTVKLSPVYSADPTHENKKFWDATPSGSIELGMTKEEAAQQFELHGEYDVTFTRAH